MKLENVRAWAARCLEDGRLTPEYLAVLAPEEYREVDKAVGRAYIEGVLSGVRNTLTTLIQLLDEEART